MIQELYQHSDNHYLGLIDSETWLFIEKTKAFFPEDSQRLSIDDQRSLYNTMCEAFSKPRPAGVDTVDYELSDRRVRVREYTRLQRQDAGAIVLYFHGGGFVVGNLDSHDDVCAEICAHTGYTVIAVDYKLAPEFTHPAAFDDGWAVFQEVSVSRQQAIILAGDSAGGTLAAGISARARYGDHQPLSQVLIYPYLGAPLTGGSSMMHANAPLLSTEDMVYYNRIRLQPGQTQPHDETFAPLYSEDFTNLPYTYVFCAQCDPLCDDGQLYIQRIERAGGQGQCTIEMGLPHGYLRARQMSTVARQSFDRILRAFMLATKV